MQVTTLARVRNDDAMQAAMELLTAAQRRQDKQAEAAACALQKFTGTEMVTMGTTGVGTQRRTRCKQLSADSRTRDEALLRHMWRQVEHVCDVVSSKASLWPRRGNLPKPRLFASPDRCLGCGVGGTAWTEPMLGLRPNRSFNCCNRLSRKRPESLKASSRQRLRS